MLLLSPLEAGGGGGAPDTGVAAGTRSDGGGCLSMPAVFV